MMIWQRYLFSFLIRSFLFFLLCILTLYIAVDFSMHGARFLSKETTSLFEISMNYLRHFSKFANLFFCLSFLLAMLRVLIDLNTHREIAALLTAGLSAKRLLSPFFFLAAILSAASYANCEWISPDARQIADDFFKAHSAKSTSLTLKVFSLSLPDGSDLVYGKQNLEKKEINDVFWIRSFQEIWHLKTLEMGSTPLAREVDYFVRNPNGLLEKQASFELRYFPELKVDMNVVFTTRIPFENRSISTLFKQATVNGADKPKSRAHLHYKLALPLVPFLSVLGIAPFAIRFTRGKSSLLFIASTLFFFIGLLTLFDALLILAENQALSAPLAIWGPMGMISIIFLVFFFRMR